jgi:hypothetical protein
MDSAITPRPVWKQPLKVGLAAGLLGIVAGVLVTVLGWQGDLLDVPSFTLPMLAPLLLGGAAVLASIYAMVTDEPPKRAAKVFGVGLLAMGTPFVIAIVATALVLAIIIAVLADGV